MTPNCRLPFVLVIAAVLLGVAWRLVDLRDWPTSPYPTLEYETALAARTVWLTLNPAERTPDRAGWYTTVGMRHIVSPPVLPGAVALVYLAVGEEVPWVAKVINLGCWLAAGAFVHTAARRMTGSTWAAAIAFAWFILQPFGMRISRSFQSESVLILAFAASVFVLTRYGTTLSWRRTLVAGVVCGAASFAKPGAILAPLALGFAAILFPMCRAKAQVAVLLHLLVFGVLLLLPSAVYSAVRLGDHVGGKLMPHLLLEGWFYVAVGNQMGWVVGPVFLSLGLLGLLRSVWNGHFLLLGLAAGHLAFCGIFTWHSATHDYYHLPMLVTTACGLGWAAAWVESRWQIRLPGWAALTLAILAPIGFLVAHPDPYVGPWRWSRDKRDEMARDAARQVVLMEQAEVVRRAIGAGATTIEISDDYGYPLQFHGWVHTVTWPGPQDMAFLANAGALDGPFSPERFLKRIFAEHDVRYFTITDQPALDSQPDTRALLEREAHEIPVTAGVRIFDLSHIR